jgi:hypothetical protein
MTYSVSQMAASRQNNQNPSSVQKTPDAPNFIRNRVDAPGRHSTNPHPDGNRLPVRHPQGANGPAPMRFVTGPCQIPPSNQPDSPALATLRGNCKALLSSLDNPQGSALQSRGIPFLTRNGEAGLVTKESPGVAAILVNGKPVLKCFNDIHYPGDTHILMAGPGGRMHAGRDLPQDYLAKANSLVQSASNSISNQGQVQRGIRRWG